MKHNILLYILVLSFNLVLGQNIKFKSLTTNDGLSNNSVNDLVSDKYCQLWVATWDGVNVYDGHKITCFKHIQNDSLSIASNVVKKFVKDINSQIWMLTDDKAISVYKGNNIFKNYYFKEHPKDILLSKSGYLVIDLGDKYFTYNKGKLISIDKSEIQNQHPINTLENYILKKYPNLKINDVLKDVDGNIWYATLKNGLYIIPNTTDNVNNYNIDHYVYDQYSPYSFASNEIVKLYQDDFGNIWLGHKDGGVSMAYKDSEKIKTILPHPIKFPHLPNEAIRAITKDNESKIWLGYYTKGLFYYSNTTNCYLPYLIVEAKKNSNLNRIRSLYTDSNGDVWVGTYGGIIRINKQGYKIYNAEIIKYFPDNRNYSFAEDEQQHLWIACWGGLAKFDLKNNKFVSFPKQEELSKYHIRHIEVENKTIAIATEENGVLLFDVNKGVTKRITVNNGLLGNSIYSIYYEKQTNYYWIATLGGVTVYDLDKGIIKNITELDGLPSHMVYSLLLNNDKFWISTTKGIASINKLNYKVSQLSPDEGWQNAEFSEGAAYQDQNGILYFGGISGLSYFQPNLYKKPEQVPKLKTVVNDDEDFDAYLKLKYHNNELKINIVPVGFTTNMSPVFYKMEGLEETWKRLENQELFYRSLPYGQYTFLTRIGNNDSTINKVFQLKIDKPFYKTILFYLVLLIFCAITAIAIISRKNILSKRLQQELEDKIYRRTATIESQKQDLILVNKNLEERNKEILKQRETLLALHHQIKNQDFEVDKFKMFVLSSFKPKLSKILTQIQLLESGTVREDLQEDTMSLVQLITEWDYLNQIKDLGDLKPSQVLFKTLITNLYEQINSERINAKTTFGYQIHTSTDSIQIDVLRFRLLFKYILNDILKYTDSKDKLTVSCELVSDKILILLKETGGLLKEQWISVQKFSPYYKAAETLVTDLKGELSVVLKANFELTISIPIVSHTLETPSTGKVILKHLYNREEITESLPVILVFCQFEDTDLVFQMLQNKGYQLIFEHDVEAVASASQQLPLHALIIYNVALTHEIIQLLKKQRFQQFPIIFITEQIDFGLQEQALEAGVNTVIHLPSSVNFIHKKIHSLLRQYQSQYQSKIEVLNKNMENKPILNLNEKLVKKAMEIIKEQLSNADFNVDKLIGILEISRTKCYRVFKEVMDQSPSDVIISLRLQKAEQLLAVGSLNVSEISFECGFNDPKYFSRLFKKYYGASPKSFQKRFSNTNFL